MDTAVVGPSNGLKIKLVEHLFMNTQKEISLIYRFEIVKQKGYVVLLIYLPKQTFSIAALSGRNG